MRLLNYTDQLTVTIGGLDITPAITNFSIRRPLPERNSLYSWTGAMTLKDNTWPPLPESIDDRVNPTRWAIYSNSQPIQVRINGSLITTLRLTDYFYDDDPKALTAQAQMADVLTICNTDDPPLASQDMMGFNPLFTFMAQGMSALLEHMLGRYGINSNLSDLPETMALPLLKDKPQGSVVAWAQQMLGERGWWLYCDPNEVVRAIRYPRKPRQSSIQFVRSRSQVEQYSRRQGIARPVHKVVVSGAVEVPINDEDRDSSDGPVTTYDYHPQNGSLIGITTFNVLQDNMFGRVEQTIEQHALCTLEPSLYGSNYSLITTSIKTVTKKTDPAGNVIGTFVNIDSPLGVMLPDLASRTLKRAFGESLLAVLAQWMYGYIIPSVAWESEKLTINQGVLHKRHRISAKPFEDGEWYITTTESEELEEYSGFYFTGFDKPPPGRYQKTHRKWQREESQRGYMMVGGSSRPYQFLSPLVLRSLETRSDAQPPTFDSLKSSTSTNSIPISGTASFNLPGVTPVIPLREDIQAQTLANNSECQALARLHGNMLIHNYYGRSIACPVPSEWVANPKPFAMAAIADGVYVLCGDIIAYEPGRLEIAWDGYNLGQINPIPEPP